MMQSHMAREVAEIPEAAQRFLAESRQSVADAAAALRKMQPRVITTVARGSSDHAATYLKYITELTLGLPVASLGPSIASIYGRELQLGAAACIGISQSGQSPDIVGMMQAAARGGALTIAVTNFENSPMAQASQHCLPLQAGVEKSVAATKTFLTSALAGLALVAEWSEDAALSAALATLPEALSRAVALDWEPLSARLSRANSAYVLGRGPAMAMASEAALKLKETSSLHAEAYSAAEVLHGPSAIVQAQFPVLVMATADAALPQVLATAERLAGQGADVFVTGAEAKGSQRLPVVQGLHPLVAPLCLIVSFYACVEALARRRGFNPDEPPHLRKVTETI